MVHFSHQSANHNNQTCTFYWEKKHRGIPNPWFLIGHSLIGETDSLAIMTNSGHLSKGGIKNEILLKLGWSFSIWIYIRGIFGPKQIFSFGKSCKFQYLITERSPHMVELKNQEPSQKLVFFENSLFSSIFHIHLFQCFTFHFAVTS